MKTLAQVVLMVSALVAVVALADSRYDGSFHRTCNAVMDGGQQLCAVTAGAYVKAVCGKPTAIGNVIRGGDGGPPNICNLTDAGMACDTVNFPQPIGEKYYSQLLPTQNGVALWSDGGSDICNVYEGK